MAYVPTNLTVYETAAAAVQMAITSSNRYPTDATSADYATVSAVATIVAQSFDTQWGLAGLGLPDTYHVLAIESALTDAWWGRTATSSSVATYTQENAALVAIIIAGHAAFVASGNVPEPWPTGTGGSTTPLARVKYVASGTTVPVGSQNGFIGLPYATISAAIAAVGIGVSVADNTDNSVYMIQPATGAAVAGLPTYPENVTGTPYRNEELDGDSEFVVINGQYNLANTAAAVTAAGGNPANKPSVNVRTLRNLLIVGNCTITDDGSLTTEFLLSGTTGAFCGFEGVFDTSACTAVAAVIANNWTFFGGYNGSSAASGAAFVCVACPISSSVTCKNLSWDGVNYGGTSVTVSNGSNSTIKNTLFTGSNPVLTGAGGNANVQFDLTSWNSFLAAGGTMVNVVATVQGISRGMGQTPFLLVAGGTVSLTPDSAGDNSANNPGNLVLCDMTGAADTVNAPTGAQLGDVFGVGNQGVGATPAKVNATNSLGGTTVIENPGNPGNYSGANGQVTVTGQGQVTWWKLISGGKWKIIASA